MNLSQNQNKNYYPSQDSMLKLKQEMKLRGFSQKIVKNYLYYITEVLKFANKGPKSITGDVFGARHLKALGAWHQKRFAVIFWRDGYDRQNIPLYERGI